MLRVDPLQRCAVLLVYDRYLAVLPFRRSETIQVNEKATVNSTKLTKSGMSWERRATAPLLATFTTCLSSSTGEKINNVIDMQFLHGFYEPTLLVLYEPIGTWAGRVSARRDTCCIVALSFNLQKRTNPVIWFQESLPYDCCYVHPVPQPIGGVVILATNSIIYLKQTLPSCGLPLNCYAGLTSDFPMRQEVPSCGPITLDGSRALALSDSQFLICTRTGKLCLLSLWVEQVTQTVSSLLLHEIGSAVPPHC
ncbi:Cleavage and polyadenylation specificity factor subunit 1, partial [Fasciolopsis buskii]